MNWFVPPDRPTHLRSSGWLGAAPVVVARSISVSRRKLHFLFFDDKLNTRKKNEFPSWLRAFVLTSFLLSISSVGFAAATFHALFVLFSLHGFLFLLVSLFLSFLCLFHRSVSYFALWQNRRLSSKHIDPRIGSWQDLKLSQPGRLQILGLPLSLKSEGQLHVGIPSKRWEKRMTLVRIENRRRRERGLIGTCSTRTPV